MDSLEVPPRDSLVGERRQRHLQEKITLFIPSSSLEKTPKQQAQVELENMEVKQLPKFS